VARAGHSQWSKATLASCRSRRVYRESEPTMDPPRRIFIIVYFMSLNVKMQFGMHWPIELRTSF